MTHPRSSAWRVSVAPPHPPELEDAASRLDAGSSAGASATRRIVDRRSVCGTDRPERVMNLHRQLAALFVLLTLAGCVEGASGQTQAPNAPYSPENVRDRGGDGGGGGGGM
jgi:hypothetical protein